MGAIREFFAAGSFMPHGMCYLRQPGILTLHVEFSGLASSKGAILVSGDTSSAIRDAAADRRIRVASKPVNADELLALIDSLLASA